ncbi:hypothetical protein HY970_00680 [Candidatus Kaiserbacteria bacterium]|nr:hypothetical protein [Candidatus Kaiserbacteria bacterium]
MDVAKLFVGTLIAASISALALVLWVCFCPVCDYAPSKPRSSLARDCGIEFKDTKDGSTTWLVDRCIR